MASSHKIVIGLLVLLLLTSSSPSMLQAARMVPSDHARADQAHVEESVPSPIGSIATASPSQDLARDMAPPMMPPSPPSGKPEMPVAKRWGTIEVADGSVPSPGVGH
ncbi:hypothetical protein SETIT_3G073600v2 [Setaria italica]|uniref:Uncharacterized protein n=1 Tax=Setaria italica TaxID=4555 RepID=K3ZB00_SETIT|nr:hypothetical protein SETIT_3G073600v2 [Setaria italica]